MSAPRPTAVDGFLRGVHLARGRLRFRAVAAVVCLSLAVAAVAAAAARARLPIEAPGRAMGVVLRWIVPLSSFALTSLAVGRARLDDSVWPLAAHGVPRRHAVLGVIAVAVACCSATAALSASLALVVAYGAIPGLFGDLTTSTWIAALGASAYAGWFVLGAGFLRLGRGRWAPLLLDFTFGATAGVLAVVWPRPHLVNLLGGEALLGMSQPSSSVALAASAVVVICLAAMRAGD